MQAKVISPTADNAYNEDDVSSKDTAPVKDNAPAEGDAPTEGDAPAEGDAPTEGDTPAEDNAFAPAPHQETLAEQRLHDDVPDADDAKFVTRSDSFLSWCALNISMTYMQSHLNLLFVLSTIVALMAILIQLALEMAQDVPRSSSGSIRPGWARHRNEGWEYHTSR